MEFISGREFRHFKSLKVMDCSDCPGMTIIDLFESIRACKNIEELILDCCPPKILSTKFIVNLLKEFKCRNNQIPLVVRFSPFSIRITRQEPLEAESYLYEIDETEYDFDMQGFKQDYKTNDVKEFIKRIIDMKFVGHKNRFIKRSKHHRDRYDEVRENNAIYLYYNLNVPRSGYVPSTKITNNLSPKNSAYPQIHDKTKEKYHKRLTEDGVNKFVAQNYIILLQNYFRNLLRSLRQALNIE